MFRNRQSRKAQKWLPPWRQQGPARQRLSSPSHSALIGWRAGVQIPEPLPRRALPLPSAGAAPPRDDWSAETQPAWAAPEPVAGQAQRPSAPQRVSRSSGAGAAAVRVPREPQPAKNVAQPLQPQRLQAAAAPPAVGSHNSSQYSSSHSSRRALSQSFAARHKQQQAAASNVNQPPPRQLQPAGCTPAAGPRSARAPDPFFARVAQMGAGQRPRSPRQPAASARPEAVQPQPQRQTPPPLAAKSQLLTADSAANAQQPQQPQVHSTGNGEAAAAAAAAGTEAAQQTDAPIEDASTWQQNPIPRKKPAVSNEWFWPSGTFKRRGE